MKGLKPFLSLAVGLLACAIMVGCAGSVPTNGPSALNIAQFTVNNGVIGIAYKFLLVASGGVTPYTWTIASGQLPPGLSMASDGVISGTPTTLGKFTFTAKVTDSQTPTAAVNQLTASITINPVLSLTATSLPSGLVGGLYNATITASNGLPPYTFTLAVPNSLPDGLTLTTTQGQNGAPQRWNDRRYAYHGRRVQLHGPGERWRERGRNCGIHYHRSRQATGTLCSLFQRIQQQSAVL